MEAKQTFSSTRYGEFFTVLQECEGIRDDTVFNVNEHKGEQTDDFDNISVSVVLADATMNKITQIVMIRFRPRLNSLNGKRTK